MKIIFQNGKQCEIHNLQPVNENLMQKIDSFLPRVEAQLHTSIDAIMRNDEITFLCDGVNANLFSFIQQIILWELKKA